MQSNPVSIRKMSLPPVGLKTGPTRSADWHLTYSATGSPQVQICTRQTRINFHFGALNPVESVEKSAHVVTFI